MFPEIDYDKVDQVWGMDIIICTTAKTGRRKHVRFSRLSTSRSGSEPLRPSQTRKPERTMAKTSSVEKNNHRRKLVAAVRRQARNS